MPPIDPSGHSAECSGHYWREPCACGRSQAYRYVRTGTSHFSMAFTYDCIAAIRARLAEQPLVEFISIPDDFRRGGHCIPFSDLWSHRNWILGVPGPRASIP